MASKGRSNSQQEYSRTKVVKVVCTVCHFELDSLAPTPTRKIWYKPLLITLLCIENALLSRH
jgi:hypothetical protein